MKYHGHVFMKETSHTKVRIEQGAIDIHQIFSLSHYLAILLVIFALDENNLE